MTTQEAAEERQPREEATFIRRSHRPGDKRIDPRFGVELDVTMSSEHNFYAGFAENLSTGGLFIATHVLKPVGAQMDIAVTMPGQTEPIQGIGEVRWIREYSERSDVPPGMGLRFVTLSSGAAELIEAFLKDRDPLFYDDE